MKTETKKTISNFTEEISDSQEFLDAVQEFESTIAGLAIDYFRRHNITENGDIDLLLRGVREPTGNNKEI